MDKELTDFMIVLRKKYNKFSEIFDLTKQLQDVIGRNDTRSVKMVMRERTQAMKEADKLNLEIEELKKTLSEDNLALVEEQCSVDFAPEVKDPKEQIFHTIYMGTRNMIQKTIDINQILQQKFQASVKGKKVVQK